LGYLLFLFAESHIFMRRGKAKMRLYQVVFKDILRRKKRVLYATIGVIIATMTVVGVITIASAGQARIYSQLEKYGANLSIIPATKSLNTGLGDLTLGTVTLGDNYISEEKLPLIRQITDDEIRRALKIEKGGNIATVAPQLLVQSEVKGASVIFVGIDPAEELLIKSWWEVGHGKFIDGPEQAIIGSIAAELLQLNVGDVISLNQINSVTVSGILSETGSGDDYQIFVPLALLQQSFNQQGLISAIDIRALCNACPVEVISDAINRAVPGVRAVAVKQVAAAEMGMLDKINKLMLALGAVTLIVGGFGVVNTLMTSVHERIKDIGIMRAVGASRNQIIKAFIYEAVVIGIIGGLLGYAAGTLLAYVTAPLIFEGTSVSFVPLYLPVSLALAILIAIISTLYPAYHATRIRVADSFRSL
jgi:putative ABC transport system permease protein